MERKISLKRLMLIFVSLLTATLASADNQGSCGDNLTYKYVEANKTLTISGSGAMIEFGNTEENRKPWVDFLNEIEHIIIEQGVTSISNSAFRRAERVETIELPAGLTNIGTEAFQYCYGLQALTIPKSVEAIGSHAFEGCSGLTSIVVEEGNAKYDSRDHCNALIETASDSLLWGCAETTLPEGIASIGHRAFYGCAIRSVALPKSLNSIGSEAFYGCGYLETVTFEEGLSYIGNSAFEECRGLTKAQLPNSVTFLGGAAFKHCAGLDSISIPNQLTTIELHLLYGCEKLTKVIIPESVVDIYDFAFYGCSGLTSMTCLNPTPPRCIGMNALDVDYTIPLYVPKGCVQKYQAADYWRNFVNIREVGDESATSLSALKVEGIQNDTSWYTIGGMRTIPTRPGIYIKNGKKVLVKSPLDRCSESE